MSGPDTRPLGDNWPQIKVEGRGHSTSSRVHNDNSTNKPMPWLVLCGIISGMSLGLAIGARDNGLKAERETRLMRLEVDELKVALQVQGIKIHEGSSP